MNKIKCQFCNYLNDYDNKFCVYCGNELEEYIKKAYCLNCRRPIEKDKFCKCGFEFSDITCPVCKTKNSYSNIFCTSCGNKLWKHYVNDLDIEKIYTEHWKIGEKLGIFDNSFYQNGFINMNNLVEQAGNNIPLNPNAVNECIQYINSLFSKLTQNIGEICSRWKVISPNYCIYCLNKLNSQNKCTNCGLDVTNVVPRVEFIQSQKYIIPKYDKFYSDISFRFDKFYIDSLAPKIGESQLEYRERLIFEFQENARINHILQENIDLLINLNNRKNFEEQSKQNVSGDYCGSSCYYYYEEYIDSNGGITIDLSDAVGFFYYCRLGHTVSKGRFCEDYE